MALGVGCLGTNNRERVGHTVGGATQMGLGGFLSAAWMEMLLLQDLALDVGQSRNCKSGAGLVSAPPWIHLCRLLWPAPQPLLHDHCLLLQPDQHLIPRSVALVPAQSPRTVLGTPGTNDSAVGALVSSGWSPWRSCMCCEP